MGIKSNPGSCAPKYLLYIPTESECSRLINSKPDKAELEQILRDAHVLDRPGGGWRRVKRFFLVRGGSNGDANITPQNDPRVVSRTISQEHDQSDSATENSASERSYSTTDRTNNTSTNVRSIIKRPAVSRATNVSSAEAFTHRASSLNPMAREFCPMALVANASRSSQSLSHSRGSTLSEEMGSSKTSSVVQSYAESSVSVSSSVCDSVSGSVTCDALPQEQAKATPALHSTPGVPTGFNIQTPVFLPSPILPPNVHMQNPPGWWEQLAQMYATFPPNTMGMFPYAFPVPTGMPMPGPMPAQLGVPKSAVADTIPSVDSIPTAAAPAFVAQGTPCISATSMPPAPPPSVAKLDVSSVPTLSGMLQPVAPPPIPPPGNTDSQMQQDFEYYKYTYGKKNGPKRNNIRTWQGYSKY